MTAVIVKINARRRPRGTRRVIIVVGKNVSPKATKRNLVKRRIRAAIQPYKKLLSECPEIVIIATPTALEYSYGALREELIRKLESLLGIAHSKFK